MDSKDSLGTYLRASVDIQSSKVQHFTPLLDMIYAKISQWKNNALSQPTKLIIINSIFIASIMHHLAIFRIPLTIANKIDCMLARFFWSNQQQKVIHWRNKDIIQRPKGLGRLGIQSIYALNEALLMKKAWRITYHPQLLTSKVYKKVTLCVQGRRSTMKNFSCGARGLFQATKSLYRNCVWKVGDGESIMDAKDPGCMGKLLL